jgi:hypothetical protein
MKGKSWIALLGMVFFLIAISSCGGGKYSDVKPVIKKYTQETEKFVNAIEKAKSGKEVAAALKGYTKFMKEMKSKMEGLDKKYPELKDMANPPQELKAEVEKMGEVAMKLGSVMMKAMKYADDPEVKKAQEEFQKMMTEKSP